jgi:hypothetical protein
MIPGAADTLGGRVVGAQLEVEGIQVEVDELVLIEPPAAPGAVALPDVLEPPHPCLPRTAADKRIRRGRP